MTEQKQILFDTVYKTVTGTQVVGVKLTAEALHPNTLPVQLNLTLTAFNVNNIPVASGELCMVMKNNLRDIDYEINNNGELIVNAPDAENYSLDSEGNLIYTYR